MMTDGEFFEVAERIVEALRPSFDAGWTDIIDGEMSCGESCVAVDDALQAASLAGFAAPPELFRDVEIVLSEIRAESHDHVRITRWTAKIPHARAA